LAASVAIASVIALPASTRSAAATRHGTGATAPITMRADLTTDPDMTRFTDAAASGQSCDCLNRTSYDALRWVPDAEMIPPGIDVSAIEPAPPVDCTRPVILHAPSSRRRKGTDEIIAACEGLDADLMLVEGLHHDEAFERYREADIVVDQLNAGWYGLFAIECMALGKPVVTFLHEEAVTRTEQELGTRVPIVSATGDTLRARLEPLVASAEERRRIGAESRAYVEQVHDLERVADRLLALYARL